MLKKVLFKNVVMFLFTISFVLFILFGNMYMVNSANFLENTDLITLQNNSFILLTYDNTAFETYNITENNVSKVSAESLQIKDYYCTNNYLYILCDSNRNLPVIKINKKAQIIDTVIISDTSIKDNCFTATKSGFLYLVNDQNSKKIYKYSSDGNQFNEYQLNENINSLFTYNFDNTEIIYAVTDSGIISVENNTFIPCPVPTSPINFYNNYCCDSNGNIFTFNIDKGFELFLETDYNNVCIKDNIFYGTKEDKIYIFDENAVPKAEYSLNTTIDKLCVNYSSIAVLCNNDVRFVYDYNFKSIVEDPSDNISSQITSSDPIPSETSTKDNSLIQTSKTSEPQPKDYSVSSNEYTFKNNIIYNIPQGTTIAQFKNKVDYGSNTVTFINHNNKNVTSGKMGTGWQVIFQGDNRVTTYYIIIYGDITGEGNINSRDINILSKYLLKTDELSEIQLIAADINNDNVINSFDLMLIDKMTN